MVEGYVANNSKDIEMTNTVKKVYDFLESAPAYSVWNPLKIQRATGIPTYASITRALLILEIRGDLNKIMSTDYVCGKKIYIKKV